jgi:hypothetical protein
MEKGAACQSQTSAASQTGAASGWCLNGKGGGLSITDRRIRMTPNGKGGAPSITGGRWRSNGKGGRPINHRPNASCLRPLNGKGGGLSITDRRIRMTPNGKGGAPSITDGRWRSNRKGGDPSIADEPVWCLNGKGRRPVNHRPALPRRPALPVASQFN